MTTFRRAFCPGRGRGSTRQRARIGACGQAQGAIRLGDGAPDRGDDIPRLGDLAIVRLRMGGEDTLGQWTIGFRNASGLGHLGLRICPEAGPWSLAGLLRGLADDRVAAALRRMHAAPERGWTVAELAREAGLSRSAFFTRFNRIVGMPPMEYLQTWRMALPKQYLRSGDGTVAEIAAKVGYGSGSAFSVAFSRQVGRPPAHFARAPS